LEALRETVRREEREAATREEKEADR